MLDQLSDEEKEHGEEEVKGNGQGHHGFGGCFGGKGGPGGPGQKWKNLMKAFMDAKDMKPEEVQQQAQANGFNIPQHVMNKWANFDQQWGKKCGQWKNKRAICWTKTAENVLDIAPGQTLFQEIWIQNGTHWPWKKDCILGMDDPREGDADNENMPIEMVNIPINFQVDGQEKFKLNVPLKAHEHLLPDGKVHEVHLAFRGPHGNTFGERITFKVRTNAPAQQIDEMTLYTLALKLHNVLKLGTFDDCVAAARANNCDEAATVIALQQKEHSTEE